MTIQSLPPAAMFSTSKSGVVMTAPSGELPWHAFTNWMAPPSAINPQSEDHRAAQVAIRKLTHARQFESGLIGEAGTPSDLGSSFKVLMRRTSASQDFAAVFSQAKTDSARLYALTGLWEKDRALYRALAATLRVDAEIRLVLYDTTGSISVGKMLQEIETGDALHQLMWDRPSESSAPPRRKSRTVAPATNPPTRPVIFVSPKSAPVMAPEETAP